MRIIAGSAVVLLLTIRAASALGNYALSVDGVDDHLTCTLNGQQVAKLDFGQTGNFPLSPIAGNNRLMCTLKDDDAPSSPCWNYDFRLTRNLDEIAKLHSTCCGAGCNVPDPVTINFNAE